MISPTKQEIGMNLFRLWRDNPTARRDIEATLADGDKSAADAEHRMGARFAWSLVQAHPSYAPHRAIIQGDIDAATRGLNMQRIHASDLAAIKTAHATSELSFMFSSKAIVAACDAEQARRARA